MDPITRQQFAAVAGHGGFDFLDPNNIGEEVDGGFFGGLISHTADGNATHALIVGPKATAASGSDYPTTTELQWRTSSGTTGATSVFDGSANTASMTNSPCANFVNGLTIDGFSDWYLPALYELDIIYFHFKPTTQANSTSFGTNSYSVPTRSSNYTTGSPARTSVTLFQEGNAQAYPDGYHWTSTEINSSNVWILSTKNGYQDNAGKTSAFGTRAIRRVAL